MIFKLFFLFFEDKKKNDYPLFGTINAEHQIMIKKG